MFMPGSVLVRKWEIKARTCVALRICGPCTISVAPSALQSWLASLQRTRATPKRFLPLAFSTTPSLSLFYVQIVSQDVVSL